MKPWILVTIFIVIFVMVSNNAIEIPERFKKQAKKIHKRCQNQTNTPDDIIRECLKGVLPKNKNLECYIQCIFDIIGIMDDSNTIHIENLLQIAPEEFHATITMLSQTCGTKDGNDKCNVAYNTLQCYVESNPIFITDNLDFLFN